MTDDLAWAKPGGPESDGVGVKMVDGVRRWRVGE